MMSTRQMPGFNRAVTVRHVMLGPQLTTMEVGNVAW